MIAPDAEVREVAGPLRLEACACGGTIGAGPAPQSVMAAVRWHNATARHQLWRRRMEIDRRYIGEGPS